MDESLPWRPAAAWDAVGASHAPEARPSSAPSQDQHGQGWEDHGERLELAVPEDRHGPDPAQVPLAAAAIDRRITIEDFFPVTLLRDADPVVRTWDRGEIADNEGE